MRTYSTTGYTEAIIGYCDGRGYAYCIDCVQDDDAIDMDIDARNSAFEDQTCDRCGTKFPFTLKASDFVPVAEAAAMRRAA